MKDCHDSEPWWYGPALWVVYALAVSIMGAVVVGLAYCFWWAFAVLTE